MRKKAHGTCVAGIQKSRLRWGVCADTADWCCCFNRHLAEASGSWKSSRFLEESEKESGQPTVFCDSVTGKPLFVAPRGRSWREFLSESEEHGWPSFRDDEVVWEHVRVLPDGETVSVDGTHLGHNIPDEFGSRYCINLVSIAGEPTPQFSEDSIRDALRGM
jgi:peptide methionine sulfoxide reductase MsrB